MPARLRLRRGAQSRRERGRARHLRFPDAGMGAAGALPRAVRSHVARHRYGACVNGSSRGLRLRIPAVGAPGPLCARRRRPDAQLPAVHRRDDAGCAQHRRGLSCADRTAGSADACRACRFSGAGGAARVRRAGRECDGRVPRCLRGCSHGGTGRVASGGARDPEQGESRVRRRYALA
ncbi:hypothetical protein D3C85_1287080 [compost metagenome]